MSQPAKWFERAALAVSSVFLAILFALLLTDVILRWLHIEFYWGSEGGGVLMAWLIFLALPMVMRKRSHLATDFLTASLPLRWASILRIAGQVLMVVYLVILMWLCAELAYRNWLGGTRSQGILRLPMYYVQSGIVFCFCLMIVSAILVVVEDVRAFARDGKAAE